MLMQRITMLVVLLLPPVMPMMEADLTSIDGHANYPGVIRTDGVTIHSGGSSEYHNVFNYDKLYPNHAD